MPSAITYTQLSTSVLDRADMTGSSFIDTTQLLSYINEALAELYDVITTAFEDYFVSTSSVNIVSGTESYNLPSDFYKLLKVFYNEGSNRYMLRRFVMDDLSQDNYLSPPVASNSDRFMRYRLLGSKIYFAPLPLVTVSAGVTLFYVPEVTYFSGSGSQAIQFNIPVGWEEFLINSAAARCAIKEQSDPSMLLGAKEEAKRRIINAAAERDAGETQHIIDKRRRFIRGRFWL